MQSLKMETSNCYLRAVITFFWVTFSFLVVSFLDFHIRSEGCNDPGMTAGTCGIAYIRVNGKDYSLHGRGHNVVIVDAKTGKAFLWINNDNDNDNIYNAQISWNVQMRMTKLLTKWKG